MVNKEIKKIFFFTLPTGLSPVLLQWLIRNVPKIQWAACSDFAACSPCLSQLSKSRTRHIGWVGLGWARLTVRFTSVCCASSSGPRGAGRQGPRAYGVRVAHLLVHCSSGIKSISSTQHIVVLHRQYAFISMSPLLLFPIGPGLCVSRNARSVTFHSTQPPHLLRGPPVWVKAVNRCLTSSLLLRRPPSLLASRDPPYRRPPKLLQSEILVAATQKS
jgi:hypothetical protein